MAARLLTRGMLAGIVAACLAVGFAHLFGEPQVELAIAFESAMEAAEHHDAAADPHAGHQAGGDAEPELVSRATQRGIGLLTATAIYGAAYGGLFALVFGFCYGRVGRLEPRALAILVAAAGFLAVVLVPALKYPANPPAIGAPETIGPRTVAYFEMLVVSLAALAFAVFAGLRLRATLGRWNAGIAAGALFVVVVMVVQLALPDFSEVPDDFPAVVLWRFRIAALGMQLVLWGVLGLLFGALAERCLVGAPGRSTRLAPSSRSIGS
jgi:predicted cobalt transporter CbtA